MFPKLSPVHTSAWQDLRTHFEKEAKSMHLRELFENDPGRFNAFSVHLDDLVFDYSKNIISSKTINLLLELAAQCGVKEGMEAMFNG